MREHHVAVGELIGGRYELTELLGRGGMGQVWAAYDQRLDRSVAVKLLTPRAHPSGAPRRLNAQDPAVARFTLEARVMAKLEHPYVPVIHDAGTHRASKLYLVMQRVFGHTLAQLVAQRGPFPVEWAAAVGAQVCSVLVQAHGRGFVHRDLTPRNVMLTADGTVRVLDFGIATALHSADEPRLTGTGVVAGTPGFISPEQGKGQPATPLSDLYALGCVLYEVLAGRPPFTAAEPLAVVVRHITDEPAPLAGLREGAPAELCELVSRLLAKRPEDRPANAAEVREVLMPWAERAVPRSARTEAPSRDAADAHPRYEGLPDSPPPAERPAPGPTPAPLPANPVSERPAAPPRPPHAPDVVSPIAPAEPDLRERAHRLAAEGRLSQALELLGTDLDAIVSRRPPSHPDVVSRRLTILRLQFQGQELQAAREGYLELAETLASDRSVPDTDLATCRVMAARCLGRLGHNSVALQELRDALDLQKEVLPPLHPEVLETRREIATLLAGSGLTTEALESLHSLAADQRSALPPEDPTHAEVERLIARLGRLTHTLRLP
ncbi:protein kinase [Streptomyces violaceusniger]|uniref:serine/threonine-protein kinase n=1 Tax=Streptomyces violaceusniger TaxID=68280 RepID=UPI00380D8668